MAISINTVDHEGKTLSMRLDRLPDVCPICRQHGGRPTVMGSFIVSSQFRPLQVVFLCPVDMCRSLFIASYRITTSPPKDSLAQLLETAPFHFTREKQFPEALTEISPHFCKIYNQALQAEENKLDEVCGPGYRKALEYLVKDYLRYYKFKGDDEKANQVSRCSLGQCIANYISEARIQACAKRAAWLGNDETHYYRKWSDKDLSDLKTLISMTVDWIHLTIQSDRYESDMQEEKRG